MPTIDITLIEHVNHDDPRLVMDWWRPYLRTDPGACSVGSCRTTEVPQYVIKQEQVGQPLGHLYTRCEHHQRQATATWLADKMREL